MQLEARALMSCKHGGLGPIINSLREGIWAFTQQNSDVHA